MTGYGRGESSGPRYKVTVEIRCTNHRYSDFNLRLPPRFGEFEERVRKLVQGAIRRGRLDLYLAVEDAPDVTREVAVNLPLARGYMQALERLAAELGLGDRVRLEHVLRAPEVFSEAGRLDQAEELAAMTDSACRAALETVVAMREREGNALGGDLEARVVHLEAIAAEVAGQASRLVPLYRERLQARLSELAPTVEVNPDRLAQELVLYAERSDISEELVRLKSHVHQMREALVGPGSEPVGRRLDFICQEMLREVNTIGSKAQDSEIGGAVIAAKEELERIREQIQNIE
jgi:uncharacterized protein (TIGR00255 family)